LLIAYIPDNSFKLPSILGRLAVKNTPKNDTELTEEKVQAIVKLVNKSAPANILRKVIGGMLLFTRTGAGYCPICKQEHVNDNTHFAVVYDQFIRLHCLHSEQHCGKKTTLVLGHLDSSHADGLRRAMLITADKIPEVFEQQNVTERAVTPLNFDKAEGALRCLTLCSYESLMRLKIHNLDKTILIDRVTTKLGMNLVS